MKKGALAAAMALLLFLCGCSSLLDREYKSVSPHLEQRSESTQESWLEADNFSGLKKAILHFIENRVEQGVIRCYGSYPGDLSRDLPRAIYQVMQDDPLGAYAVEYIPYESPLRFPAYYELRISITYSHTELQMEKMTTATNADSFKQQILDALLAFESYAVIKVPYYYETFYDLERIMQVLPLEHPEVSLGSPIVSQTVYPKEGISRIVELEIQYEDDPWVLETRASLVSEAVEETAGKFSKTPSNEKVIGFYDALRETVQLAESGSEISTLYGSLVQKKADDRGLALAFKKLCDVSEVACVVVSGLYDGKEHYWDIVKLGEGYYHVDAWYAFGQEYGQLCLFSDDQMPAAYTWETGKYPACEYNEFAYPAVGVPAVPEKESDGETTAQSGGE